MHRFWITVVACVRLAAAETWNVKVEEPAAGTPSWLPAPLAKFRGCRKGFGVSMLRPRASG
jgi:hypothetical protein